MILPSQEFHGMVLFQFLEDGLLRMEAFAGLHADEVQGITENAVMYKR